jgi:hypothetical protein
VPMNKGALRPDNTGPYTHVVDRWIHEMHTDLWDLTALDPDEGSTTYCVLDGVRMPSSEEIISYDFTEKETDFLAEVAVVVATVRYDGPVTVSYYDDEDEYKLEWSTIVEAAERQKFTTQLEELAEMHSDSTLYGAVLRDVIDNERDGYGLDYIKDVISQGCQSDVVTRLISNTDCKEFFISHLDDINELYDELRGDGMEIEIASPIYTTLSRLAYEETMRHIAQDLGLDI